MPEPSVTVVDTPRGVRLAALLSLRGRLRLTTQTGLRWGIPPSRGLALHFPGERFPRTTAAQLAWLEDRIEDEYGPLGERYTPRKASR